MVKIMLTHAFTALSGELVLPEAVASQFTATCFNADDTAAIEAAQGTSTFNAFTYNGDKLRGEWKIIPEDAAQCSQ